MKKFYFVLFLLSCIYRPMAQTAPGGVSAGLGLWIRADAAPTLSVSDSLDSWTYFNDPLSSFLSTTGTRPFLKTASLNFQPSVFFNGAQYMNGPTGTAGPGVPGAPIPQGSQAYSVFGVWQTTAGGPLLQRVWEQKGAGSANDGIALWTNNNGPNPTYGAQLEIGPYVQGAVLPYTSNTWYVSQLNLLAQDANDLTVIDQTNLTTGGVVTNTSTRGQALVDRPGLSNTVNRLGARDIPLDPSQETLVGNVAEVIVYQNPVNSGPDRDKIFSYLSFKYGIHTGASLTSSNGTVFWDATANSTYNNSVFGLGIDNGSSLNLTTSNSINTGSGNGVGTLGAANIVLSNSSSPSDQSFIVLGNDNGALAEGTPSETNVPTVALGSKRLARQWKAQVTGTPGTVDLALDLNGLTVTGTTANDFRLIVNNDGTGDFTDGGPVSYYTPTTYASGIAQFSAVTLTNNAVMAVLTKATPPTPLPVTWLGFTATVAGADVDLNWQVAANESGKVYDVEHATDGVHFTTVGQVANIASVKSYSFVHTNAGAGVHYYRIHEIDVDGKSIYSKILSVAITATDFSVRLLNNPVVSQTDPEIEINAVNAGNASIEVWTAGGARLNTLQQGVGAGSNRIRVPLGAQSAGTYILKVKLNEGTRTVQVLKF